MNKFIAVCFLTLFCLFPSAFAQSPSEGSEIQNGKPVVFIDWEGADFDMIQKTINFVEYAEEASEAQVNVRVTSTSILSSTQRRRVRPKSMSVSHRLKKRPEIWNMSFPLQVRRITKEITTS